MTTAKWVSTQGLGIVLDAEKPAGGSNQRKCDKTVELGGRVFVSRLTNGTQEGRSVVLIQIDADDGSTLIAEITLRALEHAVKAFRVREEMEGRKP